MNTHTRRDFLTNVGQGMLVASVGVEVAHELGLAPASAAESTYAAQKMARFGILAMALCRPVDFRPDEVPSLRRLVSGLLKPAVAKAG